MMIAVRLTPALPSSALTAARPRIDRIVRGLVPQFADFCLVHLVSRGGIRAVAWAHATADGERLLRALTRRYRISPTDGSSGVASVLRSSQPLLRTAIQMDTAVQRRGDRTAADLHRQLAPRCALVVPIAAPHPIGALTLCFSHSGRAYTARHIPSAARIAAAVARTLTQSRAQTRPPAAASVIGLRPGAHLRRRPVLRH